MAFFPLVRKNLGKFRQRLFLPADDLVAMHPKLGGDLVDRHFSPDGGQSDLGLEVRTELGSSGAHGSSLVISWVTAQFYYLNAWSTFWGVLQSPKPKLMYGPADNASGLPNREMEMGAVMYSASCWAFHDARGPDEIRAPSSLLIQRSQRPFTATFGLDH